MTGAAPARLGPGWSEVRASHPVVAVVLLVLLAGGCLVAALVTVSVVRAHQQHAQVRQELCRAYPNACP